MLKSYCRALSVLVLCAVGVVGQISPPPSGGGGTIPNTANLLIGGASNTANDSGVSPSSIVTPTTIANQPVLATTGNVKATGYYASGSSVKTTTNGSTAIGTTVVVVDASSFSANQGILIGVSGAVPSATTYIGTVVSVASNTITITPATTGVFATGSNVQHDDSAAFQAAITAMTTTSGVFEVPVGYYRVNKCNATTGVIVLPDNPQDTFYITNPQVSMGFTGTHEGGIISGASQLSPIIQTDCTSGALMIQPISPTGAVGGFNGNTMWLQNLTFRSYNNPTVTMLNFLWATSLNLNRVRVDTGSLPANPGPTGASVGVFMPGPGNYNNNSIFHSTFSGYNKAIIAGPHTVIADTFIQMCIHTLMINTTNATITDHAVHVIDIDIEESKNGIEPFTSSFSPQLVQIEQYEYENTGGQGPTWMNTQVNCNDPSNVLVGSVRYNQFSSSGAWNISGCGNLMQISAFTSQAFVSPTGTNDSLLFKKPITTSAAFTGAGTGPALMGFAGNTFNLFTFNSSLGDSIVSGATYRNQMSGFYGLVLQGNRAASTIPPYVAGTANDASVTIKAPTSNTHDILDLCNSAASTCFTTFDQFGNLTKLNNVTTSAPSSNVAGLLQNDGSGVWSWSAFKWVLAYNSTGQSIPGSFSNTLLTFDTSDANTTDASMHSTVSNTGRLVAPVTGFYSGSCRIGSSTTATSSAYLSVLVNGTTQIGQVGNGSSLTANGFGYNVPFSYKLNATDYVTCLVSSGTAFTTNAGLGTTDFYMHQVR